MKKGVEVVLLESSRLARGMIFQEEIEDELKGDIPLNKGIYKKREINKKVKKSKRMSLLFKKRKQCTHKNSFNNYCFLKEFSTPRAIKGIQYICKKCGKNITKELLSRSNDKSLKGGLI